MSVCKNQSLLSLIYVRVYIYMGIYIYIYEPINNDMMGFYTYTHIIYIYTNYTNTYTN